ncbi:ABC transporter substrate-binding protein [Rhodococcoides kyotonense]|uniref:ABC transporter substrate-binding protein n=1 Tax=Rhodococcoides kyotonense TaxID=398843 RepID=A0A177Y827_9NOCA|nr:ABC transporter substrate-binding protein [Rhodococcus kyotonensis]OAK51645.1 ABC transporter substrate-binding protein [Rhodococcus kyotonensis]
MSGNTLYRRLIRTLAAVSALLMSVSLATSCAGSSEPEKTPDGRTVLRYQGSTGQVTFPELAENLGYFDRIALNWVGDTTSGPQDIQSAATGDTEFGGAFNGAIVKLAAANSPIQSVLSYYGADKETFNGFYVLDGSPIRTARDLIGKKVAMNTLGAHAEFVIREWLAQQGLSKDEIAQVELTVVPPVNTEQALRQGQIDVGTLGSVFRQTAVQRGGLRELFTDESLYGTFSYGTYVLRKDFIAKNKDDVADFVQGVARAIRWTQTVPRDEVIACYKAIITDRGRNENPDLVDYWRSSSVAPGGVIADKEFQIWIDWLKRNEDLGDDIQPSDIYTNEFNPYSNGTYPPNSDSDGRALQEAK